MIVRISGEGQYRLDDDDRKILHDLEHEAQEAANAGDHDRFQQLFNQLMETVRERGERLEHDELVGSDVILPPADTTPAEAEAEFSGEGLIPG